MPPSDRCVVIALRPNPNLQSNCSPLALWLNYDRLKAYGNMDAGWCPGRALPGGNGRGDLLPDLSLRRLLGGEGHTGRVNDPGA